MNDIVQQNATKATQTNRLRKEIDRVVFSCYSLACFEAAKNKGVRPMFEVDHGNLPKGEEHRELRQFVNSMQLRAAVERIGCHSITIITCDYRDCQSGNRCQGHFIARKDKPTDPLLLITEKRGGRGDDLFKYHAVPSYAAVGRWNDTVRVWELVH